MRSVWVALVLLAGCFNTTPALYAHEHVRPAELPVPVWNVGDYWNYYVTSDDEWSNLTVEALEEKNGYNTYRVRLETSRPGQPSHTEAVGWVDVQSLGGVGFQDREGAIHHSPPGGQVFPLTNRTYDKTTVTSWGLNETNEYVVRVQGWAKITTASGIFDSVEVATYFADDLEEPAHTNWYSPVVGYFVQAKAYDHERELRAWGSS